MSKQRNISTGLVPKLRFPEFQGAGEWEESTLGTKTTKIGSGITPRGGDKNYTSKGRPFIRSQNVGWGVLILDGIVFIDESTHATFISTEIQDNDVLLNITGASIGRSALADTRVRGGNVNQHVCIIRTKKDQLNPKFTNQYLISQYGQKQIDSFQAGGNRQGLNFFQIRSIVITLPPKIQEQQKIADCLTSLDELITAHSQKLDLLKEHKKGLMQQLFPKEGETVPSLRFPKFRGAGEWEEKRLGNLGRFAGGGTPSKQISAFWDGNIPWISSSDIGTNGIHDITIKKYITKEAIKKSATKICPANSILIVTRVGVGKLAISSCEICTSQDFTNIIETNSNINFLALNLLQQTNCKNAQGTSIKGITINDLKAIKIYMPAIAEQQKIADCLISLDELITAHSQKLDLLKEHKKGLMQGLFPQIQDGSV